ncbi:amyloid fiber anchoring/assembly protein TapA [Virgibacillus dakarensis]|uniref:Amyloid fiber anchoring/assembly protein TapA n=2 Tax=Lentibacillus populi TaxID=1827502 RepID=A0A9W5TYK5_9BACI|nr:amyloid fiber anchoring/assembly protein TapA [Virgibacillus dakarensis]MTW85312.1 amyloid fiber anchoring/assembly protein TapA [Virgibacillus dakarensis]GGB45398.1 hypothetical protein GCM10011409_23730 [Lentibacillus populi]
MRMSRLRKFKSRKKFILLTKMIAVFYLATFSFSYLISGTGAYFNDGKTDKHVIQAGEWWDQSELEFIGKPTQNVKACPPTDISVQIKNNGFTMIGPTEYEIYYSENGNPKNNGEKIAAGSIDPIKEGGITTLSFHAEKVGSYTFKALQRPGYKNDEKSRHEIWSEKVMVKCMEKAEEDKQDERNIEDKSEENNDSEKTNAAKDNQSKDEQKNSEKIVENSADKTDNGSSDPTGKTESKENDETKTDKNESSGEQSTSKDQKQKPNAKQTESAVNEEVDKDE